MGHRRVALLLSVHYGRGLFRKQQLRRLRWFPKPEGDQILVKSDSTDARGARWLDKGPVDRHQAVKSVSRVSTVLQDENQLLPKVCLSLHE